MSYITADRSIAGFGAVSGTGLSKARRKQPGGVQALRRVALSVTLGHCADSAARLAALLTWRGYRFERLVVSHDGVAAGAARLLLTLTTTADAASALQSLIRRYGPVQAMAVLSDTPARAPSREIDAQGGLGVSAAAITARRPAAPLPPGCTAEGGDSGRYDTIAAAGR